MSERKGGPHKEKRIAIYVSEEHNNLLIAQSQRHKISKKQVAEKLIEANEKHGIVKEGWERQLNKKKEKLI